MTLVTMSPLSVDLLSPIRHVVVPVLLAVAGLVAVSCHSGGGGAARYSADPGDPPDLGAARTAQAASRQLAPQGEAATHRPSPVTATPGDSPSHVNATAVPYQRLAQGECFDIDREAPGTVVRRGCDRPHDAQLVAVVRLTGDHRTDQDVRDAAAGLCREPLRRKAAEQPHGTRWTTFVQYPYRSGYLLGSDSVACSLAAHTPDAAGGAARKLTAPLQ
ncbi:hypothetical protein ACFV9D_25220 [Streptomyces sp. NPDC059875]|uniref:hypothetical protein n=1 Tax=unclassified Streptomyces TaxID=2593676 RepID=UPI00365CAF31